MNILIIGYGKMGNEIYSVASKREHNIAGVVDLCFNHFDANQKEQLMKCRLFASVAEIPDEVVKKIDVAIEFTAPDAALDNFNECFKRHIPLVSGTTGWYSELKSVKKRVISEEQSFLYSSNFSVGVYLFRKLNLYLAKMMNDYDGYTPSVTEVHHIHKKDAPSGTAITLAEELLSKYRRVSQWSKDIAGDENIMPVNSVRKGEEYGTHIVAYDSNSDILEIKHTAKNRRGLALGAVMGAEFLCGKKGFFTMDDMMK